MHEMSLCESIVQLVEEQASQQAFSAVKKIWLEIGSLSGVEIDAMKFSFDVVSKHSILSGAELIIVEVEGAAWCLPCAEQVSITQRFDACPHCGSYQLQINGGEEMRIKELEVA